ncbi:MAG: UDP-4-amino-4,6-dideoxy-N-acetyl-beta-L-altrosamine transaminase [Sulfurifustaceae bacterium]
MRVIPYARQHIDEADIEAVVETLRSDWLTQGPAVERFERSVREYCGAAHAVATCNATAALHLACRALDVGEGDVVWTSPITFVASANCALYCGARIDFVDVDETSGNLGTAALERKLELAARESRLPKAIIVVHLAGLPCDMESVHDLARRYGVRIVEDASHAIGAEYRDAKVGACRYSDITIFSFHPVKIVTTGEGGMALTNDEHLYRKMRLLRSHGISREQDDMERQPDGPWYYEQIDLGYNYRMNDIQAALGCSQMRRLPQFLEARRALASRYSDGLRHLPLVLPPPEENRRSAWHLYLVRIKASRTVKSRRAVYDALVQAGIRGNVHYIPVHMQPYFRRLGFAPGDFPVAERFYAGALTLPLYYGLQESEQRYVIETLTRVLG